MGASAISVRLPKHGDRGATVIWSIFNEAAIELGRRNGFFAGTLRTLAKGEWQMGAALSRRGRRKQLRSLNQSQARSSWWQRVGDYGANVREACVCSCSFAR
jgi:hypothetical protein